MSNTILVVDDDAGMRRFLSTVLKRAGYEVVATDGVKEGRTLLERVRPDLLIADVRIGDFNGLQLLIMSPRPIPTVVLTGFPDPVIAAEARQLGASFVLKPITPGALLTLVGDLLREGVSTELRA
jgi:DNA-binding NtrC family response regulator